MIRIRDRTRGRRGEGENLCRFIEHGIIEINNPIILAQLMLLGAANATTADFARRNHPNRSSGAHQSSFCSLLVLVDLFDFFLLFGALAFSFVFSSSCSAFSS